MSWAALRYAVRAGVKNVSARLLLLDSAPPLIAWTWLTALLARPRLGAGIGAAAACGLIWGNVAKLRATDEPLVFTDRSAGGVLFYPSLYAGVINGSALSLGIGLAVCLFAAGMWMEPACFETRLPVLLDVAVLFLFRWQPPSASAVLRFAGTKAVEKCTLDPIHDGAVIGPLASVILHGAIAACERPARRRRCMPTVSRLLPLVNDHRGPIVMVQLESFFDARRIWPSLKRDLLPAFDQCVAQSQLHGLLSTSAWGANTVRTEFAALTGLSDSDLGADRFNPYVSFARAPIDSLAWRLREAGYATVCIHPFHRRFYGRDKVMYNLGFDEFLDITAFSGVDSAARYVADIDLMAKIEALLERYGPKTFIFGISIGNHSPWPLPPGVQALSDATRAGYVHGLQQTDAALGCMLQSLQTRWTDFTLAAFGDHQPSLAARHNEVGESSRMTDYVLITGLPGRSERLDIAVHRLPDLILACTQSETGCLVEAGRG
jgi:hypothetical protein